MLSRRIVQNNRGSKARMTFVVHSIQYLTRPDHSNGLEELDGKFGIVGRNITNLQFADAIDALTKEEQELKP